jgi:glutamate-1-semialdehyde 2,1-aminomutase
LSDALSAACSDAGLPATFPVVGTLVGMYFGGTTAPTNFVEAKTTDERIFRTFFHAMLAEGIALAPGAYEAVFVGLGHTDDVLAAVDKAARRAAAATVEQLR